MRKVTIPGGVFYNGDCIPGSSQIPDNSVDLIITDPPYGIEGDKLHRHYNRDESFVTDGYVEIPAEEYENFSLNWIAQAERILRPGGSIYIVSGYTNLLHILNALHHTRLEEVNHIIWKYNFGVFTSRKFVSSHYHILYYTKPGGIRTFNTECRVALSEKDEHGGSLNYQDREDVWIINREYKPGRVKNKNELPFALLSRIIQYSSNEGDLVCDLFLGGFSTARTAIGLSRNVIGFEISSGMFDTRTQEIANLVPGSLLNTIRTPLEPERKLTRKTWTDDEINSLRNRYQELSGTRLTEKEINNKLQEELGRGYWSIEKALKKTGIKPGRR
ncbi:DNA-methyltransferase [Methanospirillum stamsii]|uniref:Type II methyltransferase n=1 Tax=Methanospirillum stamsii TaxID=1277351 RepID=A0A2V2NJS7_9EURY|nr:site-specific DNA-methyltransferase [Methanospirillum stamsii]PWR75593.1 site-specific DNA-methyltransferase [Methanospirillum stamsii]